MWLYIKNISNNVCLTNLVDELSSN